MRGGGGRRERDGSGEGGGDCDFDADLGGVDLVAAEGAAGARERDPGGVEDGRELRRERLAKRPTRAVLVQQRGGGALTCEYKFSSYVSKCSTFMSASTMPSCGYLEMCFTAATASLVEYGYVMSPASLSLRRCENAVASL